MDWAGNRPHGVVLPYAYLSKEQWKALYRDADLAEQKVDRAIPLYPLPFSLIFRQESALYIRSNCLKALTFSRVQGPLRNNLSLQHG